MCWFPESQFPQAMSVTWVMVQERNLDLKESESFIMGNKPAYSRLPRETLSLFMVDICSRGRQFLYPKRLVTIKISLKSRTKQGAVCPHSQNLQKCERPVENCVPTIFTIIFIPFCLPVDFYMSKQLCWLL